MIEYLLGLVNQSINQSINTHENDTAKPVTGINHPPAEECRRVDPHRHPHRHTRHRHCLFLLSLFKHCRAKEAEQRASA